MDYRQRVLGLGEEPKEDLEKKKQAKIVETEVGKLRNLTKGEDNKKKLNEFNTRLRETYK